MASSPNLLNYSGNLVISAPNRSSVVPYLTGGVGGLTLFERRNLVVDDTETFLTGNVGGGHRLACRPLGPSRRLPLHRRAIQRRCAGLLRPRRALRASRLRGRVCLNVGRVSQSKFEREGIGVAKC